MMTLQIDCSDLNDKIDIMHKALSDEGFIKLMRWTFTDVGRKSRTMIYRDTKQDYVIKQGWAYSAMDTAEIAIGGGGVSCVIPLHGAKGHIGKTFPAKGGRRGWKIGGKYKIQARIVTTGISTLPMSMPPGGMPPFRNTAWNQVAFTRKGKGRGPIQSIVALAFPQMPLNRSENAVADHLLEYAEQRMEHHFGRLFKG